MQLLITLVLSTLLAGHQTPASYQPSVKVDVDLIVVNASVTDADGRPVAGLDKNQFQLWEDKVQQDIQYFSTEEVPVSVGVIFDVSSSMAAKLPAARASVAQFLTTGTTNDEYALIEFNSHVQVAQDFTTDTKEFQNRLAFVSSSGSTALYDAVYLGIETLRHAHNTRKALLLVTDGEDNHSHYTLSDLKELAKESDIQIYAIGMGGFVIPTMTKGHIPGPKILQDLVDVTGGQAFFTTHTDNLEEICSKISASLRTEYAIGYASTNLNKDGKWRKLRLKVSSVPHASVHARSGYYAAMP
jgi:Ca-activated chloride channel family protein